MVKSHIWSINESHYCSLLDAAAPPWVAGTCWLRAYGWMFWWGCWPAPLVAMVGGGLDCFCFRWGGSAGCFLGAWGLWRGRPAFASGSLRLSPLGRGAPSQTSLLLLLGWTCTYHRDVRPQVFGTLDHCEWPRSPGSMSFCLWLLGTGFIAASHHYFQAHFVTKTHT